MPTIADRMKEALTLRNMKQADLVLATGIGKSSISTYLTGEYAPKQKNIYKIAQALDVSEAWLMGYDVPVAPQIDAASDKKKEPLSANPDIRMIARAGKKMTSEQAENLRKYAQYMFPEAFEDDDT